MSSAVFASVVLRQVHQAPKQPVGEQAKELFLKVSGAVKNILKKNKE